MMLKLESIINFETFFNSYVKDGLESTESPNENQTDQLHQAYILKKLCTTFVCLMRKIIDGLIQ